MEEESVDRIGIVFCIETEFEVGTEVELGFCCSVSEGMVSEGLEIEGSVNGCCSDIAEARI